VTDPDAGPVPGSASDPEVEADLAERLRASDFLRSEDLVDEGAIGGPRVAPVLDGDLPESIGRYRIVERIGEGATARVFRAIEQSRENAAPEPATAPASPPEPAIAA